MAVKTTVVVSDIHKHYADYLYVKVVEETSPDPTENVQKGQGKAMDVMIEVHRIKTLHQFEPGKRYELIIRPLDEAATG